MVSGALQAVTVFALEGHSVDLTKVFPGFEAQQISPGSVSGGTIADNGVLSGYVLDQPVYYSCRCNGYTDISVKLMPKNTLSIDLIRFPDAIVRSYIEEKFDASQDGVLSETEMGNVKTIDVRGKGVEDLAGIGFFSQLANLRCDGQFLEGLDLSSNLLLEQIHCSGCSLQVLYLPDTITLTELDCSNNQLKSLDVTKSTALRKLYGYANQLTQLNLTALHDLQDISCGKAGNSYAENGLDFSGNPELVTLDCDGSKLNSLDLTNQDKLEHLNVYNNDLTGLNLLNNPSLRYLDCGVNQIETLDVSRQVGLEELYCDHNGLKELLFSTDPSFTSL